MAAIDGILQELVSTTGEKQKTAERARAEFDKMSELAYMLWMDRTSSRAFSTAGMRLDEQNVRWRLSFNKVAEYVDIYTALLAHRNPHRMISPRYESAYDPVRDLVRDGVLTPPAPPGAMPGMMPGMNPMQQAVNQMSTASDTRHKAVAAMLYKVQNYTPGEFNLKGHSELGIKQGLLPGRGCLWTEIDDRTGLPTSVYDDVKNLSYDPDATGLDTAMAVYRRRFAPAWVLQRKYNLGDDELTGHVQSANAQAEARVYGDDKAVQEGRTADIVEYYEVWKRDGLGGMESRYADDLRGMEEALRQVGLGDHVYLVIAPGACQRPLNWHPDMTLEQAVEALRWPVRLELENDPWPVSTWDPVPTGHLWPQSPLHPAVGELLFMNWVMAHLANKVQVTCRDFLVLSQELTKEQVYQFRHGTDLFTVHLTNDQMRRITELAQFLQHPPWNQDVFTMVQIVEANLEARLGLSELLSGQQGKQWRTQAEAVARTQSARMRPDAMSDGVETWHSRAAKKEAIILRAQVPATWNGQLTVLGRLLGGPLQAQAWDSLVRTDPFTAALEFEYTVEAGSVRKPDKNRTVDNAHILAQTFMQPAMQRMGMTGDTRLLKWLLTKMGQAMEIGDMSAALEALAPLPVIGQQQPAQASGGGNGAPQVRQPGLTGGKHPGMLHRTEAPPAQQAGNATPLPGMRLQ